MKNYTKENICGLKAEDFHGEIDGKNTELFVLKNKNGMELCVCNYGATVMEIGRASCRERVLRLV